MSVIAALCAAAVLQAAPSTVEVPFRVGDDAIIVDATINGRKVSCMFDTGFSGTVVLNSAINIGRPSGEMVLRDFVGQFTATTVKINSFKLGDKTLDATDMEAVQQPMTHMSFSYNTHTDGILGLQTIRHSVTEINFQRQRFIFHPKNFDITKRQPDNKRTFLARLLPMGHNSLEMEVVTSTGRKMILALDTGNAFYATTHKDVLERVGLWEPNRKPQFMKMASVASGPVESYYMRMRDLNIYGVPVPSSVWSIIDLPASSAEGDGTIGFGFLKNFNIIIDYDRRRVWLENFTGETGSEPVAEPGIYAGYDPKLKRVRIFRVTPDSPADKAGIREGDHLLAVDGQEMLDFGFRRMQKLLEGEAGSKVQLAISRSGNLMRFEIERALLVNE
jgi:predicted aspartyl protease